LPRAFRRQLQAEGEAKVARIVAEAQMWDRRLEARTPVAGLYLCGAATHSGGSVIALNGRNAAMAVLEDLRGR
jgi:phytoene dehydrogenase-like protein